MKAFTSCKAAITECLTSKKYAIAHLHKEETIMDMHIHDCYEIYYSISGGKQFLIDNRFYDINPGDLFIINQFESHYLTQISNTIHERIIISIHPDFLKDISTLKTDLSFCFTERQQTFNHRLSLNKEQQHRFLYFIGKITTSNEFGSDIIEQAAFMEMIVMINSLFLNNHNTEPADSSFQYNQPVQEILAYINEHITEVITVEQLAEKFHISTSYICRIFKATTGTTINKYINARRITIAKSLLAMNLGVSEVCEKCGFNDYSNFLKAFTKTVGISPKKYAQYSAS
jgi:AraC-like DNA-binding protein